VECAAHYPDQSRVGQRCDTFDGHLRLVDAFGYHCARGAGVERVFDDYGNVAVKDRIDCGRVDHFGSEVTELHGFHERQAVYHPGVGHDSRVGCHESVYVGPYLKNLGAEFGGDDGGCIVASAASKIGHLRV
jgi:hypothetical protein